MTTQTTVTLTADEQAEVNELAAAAQAHWDSQEVVADYATEQVQPVFWAMDEEEGKWRQFNTLHRAGMYAYDSMWHVCGEMGKWSCMGKVSQQNGFNDYAVYYVWALRLSNGELTLRYERC